MHSVYSQTRNKALLLFTNSVLGPHSPAFKMSKILLRVFIHCSLYGHISNMIAFRQCTLLMCKSENTHACVKMTFIFKLLELKGLLLPGLSSSPGST